MRHLLGRAQPRPLNDICDETSNLLSQISGESLFALGAERDWQQMRFSELKEP